MNIRDTFAILIFNVAGVYSIFNTKFLAKSTTQFFDNGECSSPENSTKFAIIVHGWRQSCQDEYVEILTSNLEQFRGGCIICMNYESAAATKYFGLIRSVDVLVEILLKKLRDLEDLGFRPSNGYLYGFSYGARLVIWAGILFGYQRLGEIDVCDMAGPFFDKFPVTRSRDAAKNVQCIHTSQREGTWGRDCHQNWNMGFCGKYQLAEGSNIYEKQSHGLCNIFYNAAFHHNFYAEADPLQCDVGYIEPYWPKNFKMGYREKRKNKVQGELFASTWHQYPFTRTRIFRWQKRDWVYE